MPFTVPPEKSIHNIPRLSKCRQPDVQRPVEPQLIRAVKFGNMMTDGNGILYNGAPMSETSPATSYIRIDGDINCGIILLADHARNALPPEYGTLGLEPQQFGRHIAYDIGVEHGHRGLARALGCPAFLTCYSRLLIDPNRGIDDPTLIMRISDGAIVPGNAGVDEAEASAAVSHDSIAPYQSAIKREIDQSPARASCPLLVSIHSFTPVLARHTAALARRRPVG